jgi:hypothetical protein
VNSSRYPGSSSSISVRDEGAGTIWSVFPNETHNRISNGNRYRPEDLRPPPNKIKLDGPRFVCFILIIFGHLSVLANAEKNIPMTHPENKLALPCWESKTNASGCHGIVLPGCFFLFFLFFLILALALCDVNCMARCAFFFSIPNGDNVTGPKEKSWRLAYHVRPAMLCVSFFPC